MSNTLLVLMAGPSASGKSTIIRRLTSDLALANILALEDIATWKRAGGFGASNPSRAWPDKLIVHYDLMRLSGLFTRAGGKRVDRIFARAGEVTVITLWTDPEELVRRMLSRQAQILSDHLSGETKARRFAVAWMKERFYTDEERVRALYRTWFWICGRHTVKAHWVFDTSTPAMGIYRLASLPQRHRVAMGLELH